MNNKERNKAFQDRMNDFHFEVMTPDNNYLLQRLDSIEAKLSQLLQAFEKVEDDKWITGAKLRDLMGISDRQLTRLITAGVIYGDAIRNIGSVNSPRYRFHRTTALNQWLKKPSTNHKD
jgi:hypothetical protein